MCPSSNFRCGSCLSKWNGKSWEESYRCVLPVKSWSLVLNEKHQLCIEGLCDIDSDLAVCIPVTDRLNSYWVSNNSTLVKLRGILNTKELPEYVAAKFAHGVPANWKEIVNKWVEFVQRGEKSSFCWEQDESFDSFDTSFLLTRSRRVVSGNKIDGNSKGKSIQRTPGDLSRDIEEERDSALPTSEDCSAAKIHQLGSLPPIWHSVSPQLPAHKVKEIFQWIDIAHLANEPEEREIEDGCRDTSAKFVAPSGPVLNRKNRVPHSEMVHQKTNNIVSQSTPRTPMPGSALIDTEGVSLWNISSVHSTLNNSTTLGSVASELFGKSDSQPRKNSPKNVSNVPPSHMLRVQKNIDVTDCDTSSDQPLINFVTESVFRKPTRGQPTKAASKTLPGKLPQSSKNAEVPGSRMGRMLSSSHRPRRRQTLQKVERWRPVLGVDGCLKVQGYLLLQCDMTAGQILTTNTVVKWGGRRVVTCDGREFELVGNPYGKIPEDLKSQLLKPLDCAVITDRLMEYQALKDRSDWGAEYELFYGNENNDSDKSANRNSRTTRNVRSNRRTTPRNTPLAKQKLKSSTRMVNVQETTTSTKETPTSSRLRGTIRKNIGSGSTSSTGLNTDSSSQTETSSHNSPALNLSVNNKCSNKIDTDNVNLINSQIIQENISRPATVNNNLVTLSNNQQDKENNFIGKSTPEATRSCFENITWRNTQNQMMMPSPRLCADSSNVDFSSSRIKVSYITSGIKSTPSSAQSSSEFHSDSPTVNESYSSYERTPKSRPSRSPTKRACLPCLQDLKPRTASHSPHSPVSQPPHQTVLEKTVIQMTSPSAVGNQTKTLLPIVSQSRSRKKSSLQVNNTPLEKQTTRHSLQSSKPRTSATSSPHRKTPGKSITRPPSPKSLRSSTRTTARQLRVLVKRLDTRKNYQNARKPSPKRKSTSPRRKSTSSLRSRSTSSLRGKSTSSLRSKSTPSSGRMSPSTLPKKSTSSPSLRKSTSSPPQRQLTSLRQQRKNVTKGNKQAVPKTSKRNEKKEKNPAAKKTSNEKPVEMAKKNKKDEKQTKNVEEKNKRNKKPATKIISVSSEELPDNDGGDDAASDCSSDSSVGPSASVIFQMNDPPVSRGKPKTLKDRKKRDAQLDEMRRKLAAKETIEIDVDDDPMANLLASHKFSPLPQEWCRHENFLGKSRKRRRPSSSDGTVSPSRSGLDDGFGNEDATSSVATPQLLMRPPDPKQVQSYLQRQRAWNAKPQRPTRQSRRGNDNLMLPHIDYAAVFRSETSDSEECASEVSLANSDLDA